MKKKLKIMLAGLFAVAALVASADSFMEEIAENYHYVWPNENPGMPLRVMRVKNVSGNYFPVYGYVDRNGKELIPLSADYATDFNSHGYAAVGLLKKDGDRGDRMYYSLLDTLGNLYYTFDYISPTYEDKMIFGQLTKFPSPFCDRDVYVMKYFYLDGDMNKWDLTAPLKTFELVSPFENGVAMVSDRYMAPKYLINHALDSIGPYDDRSFEFVRKDSDFPFGNEPITPFVLKKNGDFTMVYNPTNDTYLQPDVVFYRRPAEKLESASTTIFFEHGLGGAIDGNGNSIGPQFKELKTFNDSLMEYSSEKGRGLVNYNGEIVLPPVYRYIRAGQPGEIIVTDTLFQTGVIDYNGNFIQPLHKD